jgi:hypothetical protein
VVASIGPAMAEAPGGEEEVVTDVVAAVVVAQAETPRQSPSLMPPLSVGPPPPPRPRHPLPAPSAGAPLALPLECTSGKRCPRLALSPATRFVLVPLMWCRCNPPLEYCRAVPAAAATCFDTAGVPAATLPAAATAAALRPGVLLLPVRADAGAGARGPKPRERPSRGRGEVSFA